MEFTFKCPKCGNYCFEYNLDLTLREYVHDNVFDIRTVLPYSETPIVPEYLVLKCELDKCSHTETITIEEYVRRVRDRFAEIARMLARKQVGTPENYEEYFKKYIYDKGLHKDISESDREKNPYLDQLLKHVEKKYS